MIFVHQPSMQIVSQLFTIHADLQFTVINCIKNCQPFRECPYPLRIPFVFELAELTFLNNPSVLCYLDAM